MLSIESKRRFNSEVERRRDGFRIGGQGVRTAPRERDPPIAAAHCRLPRSPGPADGSECAASRRERWWALSDQDGPVNLHNVVPAGTGIIEAIRVRACSSRSWSQSVTPNDDAPTMAEQGATGSTADNRETDPRGPGSWSFATPRLHQGRPRDGTPVQSLAAKLCDHPGVRPRRHNGSEWIPHAWRAPVSTHADPRWGRIRSKAALEASARADSRAICPAVARWGTAQYAPIAPIGACSRIGTITRLRTNVGR